MVLLKWEVLVLCSLKFILSCADDRYRQPSSLQSFDATQPLYFTGSRENPPIARGSYRYGFVFNNANDPTKKPQDRHLKWFKLFSKKKKKEKFGKIFKKCQVPVGITVIKSPRPKYHYHHEEEEDDDDDHGHYYSVQTPQSYGFWRRHIQPGPNKRNYEVHEEDSDEVTFNPTVRPRIYYERIPPFKPIKGPVPYFGRNYYYRRPWKPSNSWRLARPGSYMSPYVLREPAPGMYGMRPPQYPMYKNPLYQHNNYRGPQLMNNIIQDTAGMKMKQTNWKPLTKHQQNYLQANISDAPRFNQNDFSKFGTYEESTLFPAKNTDSHPTNIKEMLSFESKKIVQPKHSGFLVTTIEPSFKAIEKLNTTTDVFVTITPSSVWSNSNYFEGIEQNVVEKVGLYTTTLGNDQRATKKSSETLEPSFRRNVNYTVEN